MSDGAPSAQTDINDFKTQALQGQDISNFPTLQKLIDALTKLQAQIDDLQAQINAL